MTPKRIKQLREEVVECYLGTPAMINSERPGQQLLECLDDIEQLMEEIEYWENDE